MKCVLGFIMGLWLLASTGCTGMRKGEIGGPVVKDPTVQAMDVRIAELTWGKVPLEKVLEDLRGKVGVNVIVEWQSVKADWNPETPITLTAREVTMDEALALISRGVDPEAVSGGLACYPSGGNLVITTRVMADRELVAHAYEAADLLRPSVRAMAVPVPVPQEGGGGLFASAGTIDGPTEKDFDEAKAALMASLAHAIEPEGWMTLGERQWEAAGPNARSTLNCFKGKLVVYAPVRVHKKVVALLGELRQEKR